jgi:hypothetical protein
MQRFRKFSSHPKFDKARRNQAIGSSTMTNEGKKRHLILILFLILVHSHINLTSSPSVLRGGLVFQEKLTQGPVYVNVESITLFRKADPSILVKSAQMSRSLGNLYQKICRDVANKVTLFDKQQHQPKPSRSEVPENSYVHPYDLLFSPFQYQLLDAPQVCKEMGGRRPEIRDKNSLEAIRFAAISKGIKKISAGVSYDAANNIFRFVSDDVNVRYNSPFPSLEYGGYYEGAAYKAVNWEDEYAVQQYAAKYPIIYNHPDKEFVIRLGDNADKNYREHIMCEVPKLPPDTKIKNENNLLLQVTNHACKRDEQGLLASTNIVISEIEAITNLNVTLSEDLSSMDHFLPKVIHSYDFDDEKKRKRRSPSKRRRQRCFNRNTPILLTALEASEEENEQHVSNDEQRTSTKRKRQRCFDLNRPIFATAIETRKKKRKALRQVNEKMDQWNINTPDASIVQLYALYAIRAKAKIPQPPFHIWLQSKALETFYTQTNNAEFWHTHHYRIMGSPILPPIDTAKEKAIKTAAKKIFTGMEIKQQANLYKQHQWFKNIINEHITSVLLHYLRTNKYNGITRWQTFQDVTQQVQQQQRRTKRNTLQAPNVVQVQLYLQYLVRQPKHNIDHTDIDFEVWLLGTSLELYYSTETHHFQPHQWEHIARLLLEEPVINSDADEVRRAALIRTTPEEIALYQWKYKHDQPYKTRMDQRLGALIKQYLRTERINGLTRNDLYSSVTDVVKSRKGISYTTTTTSATSTTQTTTRRTTTTTQSTTSTASMSSSFPIPPTPAPQIVQVRTRRAPIGPLAVLGIGLGATAAANVLSSSITGDAPLSWGGKTIGGLFGLKTSGSDDLQAWSAVGQAMEDLKINQNEIASTMYLTQQQMGTIISAVDGNFKSTATMIIEQDIKMYVRHLLLVQQNAIQKYAHIMLASSVRQTSPFALSQKELDQTADELKTKKGIILVRDLSSTRMEATIIDNELYIKIDIPIINENNLFNFYQIKPVPVFSNNKTLVPDIDAKAIAISKSGSDYVIVNNDEFETCTNRPWQCKIATPITPMSQNSHCVASTYVTKQLTCPLIEKDYEMQPFFHIDGNYTIYSVPRDTRLYIKCSESNLSNRYKDESVTIRGMGEAIFKYSCTITLPTGAKFSTPSSKTTENTSDLKIFELLKVYPLHTGITIEAPKSIVPNHTAVQVSLLDVEVPTKAELTYEAFHPLRSIPFLIRLACIIAFFVVMALAIKCFWPNIRAWLGRKWYCCCFGPTTEEQEQQRREDNARKLQIITDELNVIKQNAKIGAQKWKQSTTSIMSNIQKARSMSNLYSPKDQQMCKQSASLLDSSDSLPPPPPSILTPSVKHNTRIVYKAEPTTPTTKRVSFTNGRLE